MSQSNRYLFTRIALGDEQAFNQVFYAFSSPLHVYVVSIVKNEHDARDVMQELFLKVWLKKENLADIENPSAWLYEAAFNSSLNFVRKEENRQKYLTEWEHHCPKQELSVEEIYHAKQLQDLVQQGIEALPTQRKRVYKMKNEELLTRARRLQKNWACRSIRLSINCLQQPSFYGNMWPGMRALPCL